MKRKLRIAIVGSGRLGTTMAAALLKAGFRVSEIVSRDTAASKRRAATLARRVGARALTSKQQQALSADVVWLCVPDREIRPCASALAEKHKWRGRIAIHASGALSSEELAPLRRRGASVASLHPLMTFVVGTEPMLEGVPFAIEGDAVAVRTARGIVSALKGKVFVIPAEAKAAYHAWGAFTSPLLVAALVTGEQVAALAGIDSRVARQRMLPIVLQTVSNYVKKGPQGAFSGPIVRGDTEVVAKHLKILKRAPIAREVYLALAKAAVATLPTRNRKALEALLRSAAGKRST
jgi:predicted short-subunit dehydrogenase-like oxidoreductase (DUF2520 family)